eukprot:211725-Rhodomonas_salina.1
MGNHRAHHPRFRSRTSRLFPSPIRYLPALSGSSRGLSLSAILFLGPAARHRKCGGHRHHDTRLRAGVAQHQGGGWAGCDGDRKQDDRAQLPPA